MISIKLPMVSIVVKAYDLNDINCISKSIADAVDLLQDKLDAMSEEENNNITHLIIDQVESYYNERL